MADGAARRMASSPALRGTVLGGADAALKSWPQWRQNLAEAETAWPQLGQARSSGWPQFSQKRASAAFSKEQFGHSILAPHVPSF
jgi:hypothetical protein